MELINCKACNKKISPNAKFCPHCGEPNKEDKKLNVKAPNFLKSKKMITVYIILGLFLVGYVSIRIIFNDEFKCYKVTKKMEREYGYTCEGNALIEMLIKGATNKRGAIQCDRKKDDSSVDIYFGKNKTSKDESRISIFFFGGIGDDGLLHLSSENYYGTATKESEIDSNSKEFPPYNTNYKESMTCFYYPGGSKVQVGKKLEFDFEWANELFYKTKDSEEISNIKSYCLDSLKEVNKLKSEFEDYLDGSGIKLGE